MTTDARINCPICYRPIDHSAWKCQFCGEDVVWALEQRRLAKDYLRYTGVALIGSALLSAALLVPFGFLAMLPGLIIPLWVALLAFGAAVWLMGGGFERTSSPEEGKQESEEAQRDKK